MARTVKGKPAGDDNPQGSSSNNADPQTKGYHSPDIAMDRLCMLHQSSVRTNQKMETLIELFRSSMQEQAAGRKEIEKTNKILSQSAETLNQVVEQLKRSYSTTDELEPLLKDFVESAEKNAGSVKEDRESLEKSLDRLATAIEGMNNSE